MTSLRNILHGLITLVLMAGGEAARAEGVTGEIQVVSVPGRDTHVQRSLTEISAYLEYGLTGDVSVFAVGYYDQEFRSATIGLARKLGDWQLGLGVGHASFDDMSHQVINPWA